MQVKTVVTWVVTAGVAFAAGIVLGGYRMPAQHAEVIDDAISAQPGHHHPHAVYVCPMHPKVVSDKPGTCPVCGMALVAAKQQESDHEEEGEHLVKIAPEVVNNLGVKLASVTRSTLMRRVDAPGFVQQIEPAGHVRVQAPFDAKIVALNVRQGQWLDQGKPMLTLESEQLRDAEQAHVSLLQGKANAAGSGTGHAMTLEESREQLARLGLSGEAIQQLEQKREAEARLTLYAPYPGQIGNLQAAAGGMVKSGTMLFELSGLARATVLANAFQRDAAWIQTGQPVEVRLPHVSSQTWHGIVNQGAVSVDPSSQNIGVRLSFTAPASLLKSAMYVVASISGEARRGVLAVPQEALIRTEMEDRVIVALGDGRFKPVKVRCGIDTGGKVEIVSGLKEGDKVVVSSQFLIDSESSLQASFNRMAAH